MTDIQKQLAEALRDIDTVLRVEGMDLEIGSRRLLKEVQSAIRGGIEALAAYRQQEARKPLTGWASTEDRMPNDGEEVLVCVNYSDGSGPYVMLDRWVMNREDPLGMGGPTIDMGFDWDNNEPMDVTHWMPLPAPPKTEDSQS